MVTLVDEYCAAQTPSQIESIVIEQLTRLNPRLAREIELDEDDL